MYTNKRKSRCPLCKKLWAQTSCPICGRWFAHDEWYILSFAEAQQQLQQQQQQVENSVQIESIEDQNTTPPLAATYADSQIQLKNEKSSEEEEEKEKEIKDIHEDHTTTTTITTTSVILPNTTINEQAQQPSSSPSSSSSSPSQQPLHCDSPYAEPDEEVEGEGDAKYVYGTMKMAQRMHVPLSSAILGSKSTPMHWAAAGGHIECLQAILSWMIPQSQQQQQDGHNGNNDKDDNIKVLVALIEAEDNLKRTPLHYAAFHGHVVCVGSLLQCGANPCAYDAQGTLLFSHICIS